MDFVQLVALFFAGNIMFIAPCTLPLVPGYLSLISGIDLNDISDSNKQYDKKLIIINGASFMLGFSLVFILFGLLIGLLGSSFLDIREIIIRISGLVVIIFGFNMLGLGRRFNFLNFQKRIKMPNDLKTGRPTSSLIMGSAFGAGWTPCVGPALGAAIGLASNSATAYQGAIQLAVFSAGMAIPFMAMAATAGWSLEHMKKIMKITRYINIFGALFFILIGYILLTDQVHLMSEYSFKILDWLGLESIVERL